MNPKDITPAQYDKQMRIQNIRKSIEDEYERHENEVKNLRRILKNLQG